MIAWLNALPKRYTALDVVLVCVVVGVTAHLI